MTDQTPVMTVAEALLPHMDAGAAAGDSDLTVCECGEQIDRSGDNLREHAQHKVRAALDEVERLTDAQIEYADTERDRLRIERDAYGQQVRSVEADRDRLLATIERVRALHRPLTHCPDDLHDPARCPCGMVLCTECGHHAPCPTLAALDAT